jgi:hypothetical protein
MTDVVHSDARATLPLATRDEVDAYERKLRRKRYGAVGAAALVTGALVGGALWMFEHRSKSTGLELEPNDTAAQATPLALGETVRGHLGERIDAEHGDRDFYAFDVANDPQSSQTLLSLRVSSLPNIPMCTMLYRTGFTDPVARYCVGRPGRDLVVPAMALEPGHYFVAVVQDLSPWAGAPPFIYENVSDTYTVTADVAHPTASTELEPNDTIASASVIELGTARTGALAWTHDEDVYCVASSTPDRVRWKIRTGPRESGVLEATTLGDGESRAPVRIHDDGHGKQTPFDAVSPWQSDAVDASGRACIRLRLAPDPWSDEPGLPHGGSEPYVIKAEIAIP